MTSLEFDSELVVALPLFSLGAILTLGLTGSTTFIGVDFASAIYSYGHVDVTLGRLLSIGALGYVVVNRDWELRELLNEWSVVEAWIVYATLGLILAPPIFPAFEDTLLHGPGALIAFMIQTIGFTIVSYLN